MLRYSHLDLYQGRAWAGPACRPAPDRPAQARRPGPDGAVAARPLAPGLRLNKNTTMRVLDVCRSTWRSPNNTKLIAGHGLNNYKDTKPGRLFLKTSL
jgi:hypothetical protein